MARAEVPRVDALGGRGQRLERGDVAGGEVLDVDVVAHAGAVDGVVVVAEDAELLALAHRDLGDERHQVVGDAGRVLADRPGLVRADRVEVAQQGEPHLRRRDGDVAQDLLLHHLGPAVGVGGEGAPVLGRAGLVGAVDRGAGGEDELVDVVLLHRADQREGGAEVVLVVVERLLDALADRLVAGEVDDRVEALGREQVLGLVVVAEVEGVRSGGSCRSATPSGPAPSGGRC